MIASFEISDEAGWKEGGQAWEKLRGNNAGRDEDLVQKDHGGEAIVNMVCVE